VRRPLPPHAEAVAILERRRPRPPPRPPPHAARGLAPTLKALEAKFGPPAHELGARWTEIVGEALAARTEPVRVIKARNGGATLELKVAGAVAALVQHQAPLILDRLGLYLGSGAVTRLRIVQGPIRRAAAARRIPGQRARPPLDAAAEAQLAEGLEGVRTGPLKEALARLGREVLRGRSK
jgi:hypothetical protein